MLKFASTLTMPLQRLSVSAKATLIAIIGIVLTATLVATITIELARVKMLEQATAELNVSLGILLKEIRELGVHDFERVGGDLYYGPNRLNGRLEIVDQTAAVAGGLAAIFAGETRVASNSPGAVNGRDIGTSVAPGPIRDTVFRDGAEYRGTELIGGSRHIALYHPLKDGSQRVVGALFVALPQQPVDEAIGEVRRTSILMTGLVALLWAIIQFLAQRWQLAPLRVFSRAFDSLAHGRAVDSVPATSRQDEIGVMARSVGDLAETVRKAFRQAQMIDDMPLNVMFADPSLDFRITYANRLALKTVEQLRPYLSLSGDVVGSDFHSLFPGVENFREILSDWSHLPWQTKIKIGPETVSLNVSAIRDQDGAYVGVMLNWKLDTQTVRLADDFEGSVKAVVNHLSRASSALDSAAVSLNGAANDTSREVTVVSTASEQATANVETVAAAAEQLSASIQEIARQVADAADVASRAADQAGRTGVTVTGLDESAQRIGEVVGLINAIAEQTNLLALNATIEAARAGDAGKGFAVVAQEVKNLANQTAKATEEIQEQIAAIQGEARSAVSAIREITVTIEHVNGITTSVAAAVEEQGAATGEISRNVQQAAIGTRAVAKSISKVVRSAGETSSAAGSVHEAAESIAAQASSLRQQVDTFVVAIRSL